MANAVRSTKRMRQLWNNRVEATTAEINSAAKFTDPMDAATINAAVAEEMH